MHMYVYVYTYTRICIYMYMLTARGHELSSGRLHAYVCIRIRIRIHAYTHTRICIYMLTARGLELGSGRLHLCGGGGALCGDSLDDSIALLLGGRRTLRLWAGSRKSDVRSRK